MSEIRTPVEMLAHWSSKFPDQTYLRQSHGDFWKDYSWSDVSNRVVKLASYISSRGFPNKSRIALWSSNSVDWVISDLAIMMAGHISVPIYPAQDFETAEYILNHSDPVMILTGSFEQSGRFSELIDKNIESIAIHGCEVECDLNIEQIYEAEFSAGSFPSIEPDDTYTIIYSSGTSGKPKGVILTFRAVSSILPILTESYDRPVCEEEGDERERVISYLPMSHAAERSLILIASLYLNSCVSISAGLEHFAREIVEVKPTMFGAVPRIWYKFMTSIKEYFDAQGKTISSEEDKELVRQLLGLDKARTIVTGSAPVSPAIHEWYANVGLHLKESYGSTETFAYGTLWSSEDAPVSACLGMAVPGVEVKLDDSAEILIKSPVLMSGYYRDEERTAEALRDGWYLTGDLGEIDKEGNLWLTGRVGSIFKTSKGKFINPERIEHEFQKASVVDQVMVFGHGLTQPVAVANITESFADKRDSEVKAYFESALSELNNSLPPYERLSSLLLVRTPWSVDAGELTPTLKIKRSVIQKKYEELVPKDSRDSIVLV